MALDVASFLAEFPELSKAPVGLVQAKLAEATLSINPVYWGALTDTGIKYLTAHLIATSPGGLNSRLDPKAVGDVSSTYGLRFRQLASTICVEPQVIT